MSDTLTVEKKALLDFKHGLEDPTGVLEPWIRESDPCRDAWPGIVCSATQRVQEIHLPSGPSHPSNHPPLHGNVLCQTVDCKASYRRFWTWSH